MSQADKDIAEVLAKTQEALAHSRMENAKLIGLLRSIKAHYAGLQSALLEACQSIGESKDPLAEILVAWEAREKEIKEAAEAGVQKDGTG